MMLCSSQSMTSGAHDAIASIPGPGGYRQLSILRVTTFPFGIDKYFVGEVF